MAGVTELLAALMLRNGSVALAGEDEWRWTPRASRDAGVFCSAFPVQHICLLTPLLPVVPRFCDRHDPDIHS